MQTAVSLSDTVSNIVLIGLNSGLHASRLGAGGLGLVIIAHEIKAVADKIVADAARLSPIFSGMQTAMTDMKQCDVSGSDRLASLDGTMRQSMAWMTQTATRLHETLAGLSNDSVAFAAVVAEARSSFARASETADRIIGAAETLEETPGDLAAMLQTADPALIAQYIQANIWPTYTMAIERDLHTDTLDQWGLCSAPEALNDARAA